MFERRNIEVESGQLRVGLENLFDDINDVESVLLYVSAISQMQLMHSKKTELCVHVDANDLDEFAIAWCKKRKLQGALGGPVGKEWGGPDCEYD